MGLKCAIEQRGSLLIIECALQVLHRGIYFCATYETEDTLIKDVLGCIIPFYTYSSGVNKPTAIILMFNPPLTMMFLAFYTLLAIYQVLQSCCCWNGS